MLFPAIFYYSASSSSLGVCLQRAAILVVPMKRDKGTRTSNQNEKTQLQELKTLFLINRLRARSSFTASLNRSLGLFFRVFQKKIKNFGYQVSPALRHDSSNTRFVTLNVVLIGNLSGKMTHFANDTFFHDTVGELSDVLSFFPAIFLCRFLFSKSTTRGSFQSRLLKKGMKLLFLQLDGGWVVWRRIIFQVGRHSWLKKPPPYTLSLLSHELSPLLWAVLDDCRRKNSIVVFQFSDFQLFNKTIRVLPIKISNLNCSTVCVLNVVSLCYE